MHTMCQLSIAQYVNVESQWKHVRIDFLGGAADYASK